MRPQPRFGVEAGMGANIEAMRVRRGMRAGCLAHAANITPALLHDYEAGTIRLSTDDLLAIVEVLGVKISEVFAS